MQTISWQRKILRAVFLICTGGMIYYNIEILFRGFSHISMFFCGGLSFFTIGALNEHPNFHPSFLTQMVLGTFIITGYEFATGLMVNLILRLRVWDYSDMPFMLVWFVFTPLCIVVDDIIRYALFGGKIPSYIKALSTKSKENL